MDTNVLVSAFATRGLSADVPELVIVEHKLVTGRTVLNELDKALRVKLKVPAPRCAEAVAAIAAEAAVVVDEAPAADCDAEEDDKRVLGEAIAAQAEAFVTGDAALVALGAVGSMRILTPRQLWELLRSP